MKILLILFFLYPVLCMGQHPFINFETHNIGEVINTEYSEMYPMILSDGLTLFFSSNRPGGLGGLDIYVTTRKTRSEPWQKPVNLGTGINSKSSDHSVTVSEDGHWMIFFSSGDLYISYRNDTSNPTGWEEAQPLNEQINSSNTEACPLLHIEGDKQKLYFVSNRPNGIGKLDIYVSTMTDRNTFSKPVLLKEVSSPSGDYHFEPSSGLIWSDREGGKGKTDLWIATKRTGEFTWTKPINLGKNINTSYPEGMPSITHDQSLLIFHSNRPGGYGRSDIYYAKDVNSGN
ncbi:MAG: hypothetical protein R3222_08260 [Balneolaceae bacterium]|nr:hypothetical protein [Balneolaceae bacterium]